jgi:hypothetical protein
LKVKLTLADIREAKRQLTSTHIAPNKDGNYIGVAVPRLRGGIIWFGLVACMHPSSFLDMFGKEQLLAIDADISKRRIQNYIKRWEKAK